MTLGSGEGLSPFRWDNGLDRPPSMAFEAFPKVVDVPIDHKNPVTGR
jgi:hypothetical protein